MKDSNVTKKKFDKLLCMFLIFSFLSAPFPYFSTLGVSINFQHEKMNYPNETVMNEGRFDVPTTQGTEISIKNEYLSLFVETSGSDGIGTFTLKTYEGEDLLFTSRPWSPSSTNAWSSFTTIKIDNKIYTQSTENSKITDSYSLNGYVSTPPKSDGNIIFTAWLIGKLEFIQELSLVGKNVKFKYRIRNLDTSIHNTSLRVLFDTQVRDQDGSPFWVQDLGVITKELKISNPSFSLVYSYDSIPPSLSGVFTFVTQPSYIIFGYWPSAFKSAYEYSIDPQKSFYNPNYKTSPKSDSCLIVYWEFINLSPNDEKTVEIYYGLEPVRTADLLDLLNRLESVFISSIDSDILDYSTLLELAMEIRDWNEIKQSIQIIWTSLIPGPPLSGGAGVILFVLKLAGFTVSTAQNLINEFQNYLTNVPPEWARAPADHKNEIINYFFRSISNARIFPRENNMISVNELKAEISNKLKQLRTRIKNSINAKELNERMVEALAERIRDTISCLSKARWSNIPLELIIPNQDVDSVKFYVIGSLRSYLTTFEDLKRRKESLPIEWVTNLIYGGLYNAQSKIQSFISKRKVSGSPLGITTMVLAATWAAMTFEGFREIYEKERISQTLGKQLIEAKISMISIIQKKCEAISDLMNLLENGLVMKYIEDIILIGSIKNLKIDDLSNEKERGVAQITITSDSEKDVQYYLVLSGYAIPLSCSWCNAVPVFITWDKGIIKSGENKQLMIPYVGITTYDEGSEITVIARLLLSDGFRLKEIDTKYGSFSVGFRRATTQKILEGNIAQNEIRRVTLTTRPDTAKLDLILYYSGSRVDLHVYDKNNRHVGRDYQTGIIESQIPGATMSGVNETIQRVFISNATGQVYRIEIVGVEAMDMPRFVLTSIESPNIGPVMKIIPGDIRGRFRRNENISIAIREVGYVSTLRDISINVEGNISNAIRLDNMFIPIILPGHLTIITAKFIGPPGFYSGSIVFNPINSNSSVVLISIRIATLGDINNDGVVNYQDLATLISQYGTKKGDIKYSEDADLNGDEEINYKDLAILISNYGKSE